MISIDTEASTSARGVKRRYLVPEEIKVPPRKSRSLSVLLPFACALALALCVIAAHPVVEMGMNDDWSYIWSARVLANTGHVVYNGWATAMLGWQLYLGALFIKLFGFSFTAVRASTLVVAMASVALLQRIFVRLGAREWNATLATLTIALSPLFLAVTFSFMSDIAGLFTLLVCVYCCIRAMQAEYDGVVCGWLIAAAVFDVTGGTVRQVAWLGALAMVPSTAWWLRRRRGVLPLGAALWLLSVISIVACMHWFSVQPYSLAEPLLAGRAVHTALAETGVAIIRDVLALCVFLLPVTIAFAVQALRTHRRSRRFTTAAVVVALTATLLAGADWLLASRHHSLRMITPFSRNLVTARGMIDLPSLLGERPDVIPVWLRIVLCVLIAASLVGLWMCVREAPKNRREQPFEAHTLSGSALLALLGPFTAAYVLLLVTRAQIFDRYLLPLLLVPVILLIRFFQQRYGDRLPAASLVLVIVFAVFGVAALHDVFALSRARLEAANALRSQGIPRDQFRAGFEYDAWTQLERTGYINDPRLRTPTGSYHTAQKSTLPQGCQLWFTDETPSVHGRYGLSFDRGVCHATGLPPTSYTTWLPPHNHQLYVEALPAR